MSFNNVNVRNFSIEELQRYMDEFTPEQQREASQLLFDASSEWQDLYFDELQDAKRKVVDAASAFMTGTHLCASKHLEYARECRNRFSSGQAVWNQQHKAVKQVLNLVKGLEKQRKILSKTNPEKAQLLQELIVELDVPLKAISVALPSPPSEVEPPLPKVMFGQKVLEDITLPDPWAVVRKLSL